MIDDHVTSMHMLFSRRLCRLVYIPPIVEVLAILGYSSKYDLNERCSNIRL